MNKVLYLEREKYINKNSGKENYSYFVKGSVKGKELKAQMSPPDISGYAILDIIFDENDKVELKATPFSITDKATGQVITGNTYSVQYIDEDGEIIDYKVKPYKPTDKTTLKLLLK